MPVWDVLGKRTENDEFVLVGGIMAPDVEMALVLARETHFRHKEGVAYAVRRRGDDGLHVGPYEAGSLGGITDHSYRRQEAYTGVGAKHKAVSRRMSDQGLAIDRPRPGTLRRQRPVDPATVEKDPRSIEEIPPEEIASQGTGG